MQICYGVDEEHCVVRRDTASCVVRRDWYLVCPAVCSVLGVVARLTGESCCSALR